MDGDAPQTGAPQGNTPTPPVTEGGVSFDAPKPTNPPEAKEDVDSLTVEEVDRELAKAGVKADDDAPSWLAEKKAALVSKPAPTVPPKPAPKPEAPKGAPVTFADIKNKNYSEVIRPLRTYKDDIARAIKRNKVSTTDMSVAQQQRKLKKMEEEREQLELKEKIEKDQARLSRLATRATPSPKESEVPEKEIPPPQVKKPETKPSPAPQEPPPKHIDIKSTPAYEAGELARVAAEARKAQYPQESVLPKPPPKPAPDPKAELAERLRASQAELNRRIDIARESTPIQIEERVGLSRAMKIALASFALVILGVGTLAGTLYLNREKPNVLAPLQIDTLVFAEQTQEIPVQTVSGNALVGLLANRATDANTPLNAITHFKLTVPIGERDGAREITAQEFFERAETNANSALVRSLHPKYMLGLHSFNGNQPFLVFKTSFYENAFAGMLEWERTISRDLAPLFGQAVLGDNTSSTTESSVGPTGSLFRDRLVNNKDTRVLLDVNGQTRLLYSFIDRQTLIITTNRETFIEVASRLNSTRVER